MHKITFYPLGNADTSLIQLKNGKNILFDYAHSKLGEDDNDKRCDLAKELNKANTKDYFDIVSFTHLDNDHVSGSKDYFYFDHAVAYQSVERKKIREMWVPAEIITESRRNDLSESAKVVQAEARYRMKNAYGIKIFSSSKKLKEWCDKNDGYSYDNIKHLIVNAGTIVNSLSLINDGIEVFAHCPFYSDSLNVDRNNNAIVVQCTFDNIHSSKLILGSDIDYDVWENIIQITINKGNPHRLEWDLFHLSHHCSYRALSNIKGERKTNPSAMSRWLYEKQKKNGGRVISPSNIIPLDYAESTQPPHRQAYNYYIEDANAEVKVTMEYPSKEAPKPMIFNINQFGVDPEVIKSAAFVGAGTSTPPRAGKNDYENL